MHNILAIFKNDVLALKTSVIAAIVAIGLILVPPMYAWLTTLGFWDPYANSGSIKVAVANEDEGYSSALIPTKINAGDQVIARCTKTTVSTGYSSANRKRSMALIRANTMQRSSSLRTSRRT